MYTFPNIIGGHGLFLSLESTKVNLGGGFVATVAFQAMSFQQWLYGLKFRGGPANIGQDERQGNQNWNTATHGISLTLLGDSCYEDWIA